MKKFVIAFLISATIFFSLVFSLGNIANAKHDDFQVAMITDIADVNDASFNQACYEGAKEWSNQSNVKFNYYKPSSNSLAERVKSFKLAIDRGYNVIICPGFAAGKAIAEVAPLHPDVKFIGLDISEGDFPEGFTLTNNIAIYNYHEEIAGYLAGYATVKDGYTRLGFLGGMDSPAVINYGYGYVQGINAAAVEKGTKVDVQYVYGGQFFGDSDIYKHIDNWYKVNKTQVVFSCGGSIYTSVALAAKENNGYMIGVDSDQAPIIDKDYKEGICITSAMKGMKQTVFDKLDALYKDKSNWEQGMHYLGLVSSDDPSHNYVQLALDHWRLNNYSIDEYKSLLKEIIDGERVISSDITTPPLIDTNYVSVNYQGKIK